MEPLHMGPKDSCAVGEWVTGTGQCCRAQSTPPCEGSYEALGNTAGWRQPVNAMWWHEAEACTAGQQHYFAGERWQRPNTLYWSGGDRKINVPGSWAGLWQQTVHKDVFLLPRWDLGNKEEQIKEKDHGYSKQSLSPRNKKYDQK